MKPLLFTLILLCPHAEYEYVLELIAKRALYAHEEHQGKVKSDTLYMGENAFIFITSPKLENGGCLVKAPIITTGSASQETEYIYVDNEIRYIGMSVTDTVSEIKTWVKAECYFSEKGNGVKDKKQIEITTLPLSKSDSMRMFTMDNEPERFELEKDYLQTLSNDLRWLTKKTKNYTQPITSNEPP